MNPSIAANVTSPSRSIPRNSMKPSPSISQHRKCRLNSGLKVPEKFLRNDVNPWNVSLLRGFFGD